MDLGLWNLLCIFLMLVLAGLEYRKTSVISPWVNVLLGTVTTLFGYYFIPISAPRFGLLEGDAIIAASDQALILNLVGTAISCVVYLLASPIFSSSPDRTQVNYSFLAFPKLLDMNTLYVVLAIAPVVSIIVLGVMAYTGVFPLLSGELAESRAFINNYPELRPIFNFATSLIAPILNIVMLFVVLRWGDFRKIVLLPIVVLIVAGLLTGTRNFLSGLLSGPILGVSLLWVSGKSRFRLRLWMLLTYQVAFIILGGITGLLRGEGLESVVETFTSDPGGFLFFSFLFAFTGDTFSDLRDFSWVLSRFTGDFLQGKTILAGVLGFIPSIIFPFREEYTFSRVTNTIVGLPIETHFGLRASRFGEWYLNFGWFGVIAISILLGIGYAYIQGKFNALLFGEGGKIKVFSILVVFLMATALEALTATNTLFIIYVQAVFLLIIYLFSRQSKASAEMEERLIRSEAQQE